MNSRGAAFLIALVVVLPAAAEAAAPAETLSIRNVGSFDLLVPDAPAFTILAGEQSAILRPGTTRELSAELSQIFSLDGKLAQAAALEVAPYALIAGSGVSLSEYQDRPLERLLYRLRFSVGTRQLAQGAEGTALGLGLRLTLYDASDPRMQRQTIDQIRALMRKTQAAAGKPPKPSPDAPSEEEVEEPLANQEASDIDILVRALRERKRAEYWNRGILELGLGWASQSPDRSWKGLQSYSGAVWLSGGFPLGRRGQLVGGLRGQSRSVAATNAGSRGDFAAALRSILGGRDMRGYLDSQGVWTDHKRPDLHVVLGIETRISNGLWLSFDLGPEWVENGAADILQSVAIKLGD